jgi:hypothetical protein
MLARALRDEQRIWLIAAAADSTQPVLATLPNRHKVPADFSR